MTNKNSYVWVMMPVPEQKLSEWTQGMNFPLNVEQGRVMPVKGRPTKQKEPIGRKGGAKPTKARASPKARKSQGYGFFTNRVLDLIDNGTTSGAAIAKEMGVEGSRVYPVLTYLRKNGYIEGFKDEIELTKKGREKLQTASDDEPEGQHVGQATA